MELREAGELMSISSDGGIEVNITRQMKCRLKWHDTLCLVFIICFGHWLEESQSLTINSCSWSSRDSKHLVRIYYATKSTSTTESNMIIQGLH